MKYLGMSPNADGERLMRLTANAVLSLHSELSKDRNKIKVGPSPRVESVPVGWGYIEHRLRVEHKGPAGLRSISAHEYPGEDFLKIVFKDGLTEHSGFIRTTLLDTVGSRFVIGRQLAEFILKGARSDTLEGELAHGQTRYKHWLDS